MDTGADVETIGDLNASFADFWKEADTAAESSPAPEAPAPNAAGAAQETKKEPEIKPPKTEPAPTPKPTESKGAIIKPIMVDSDDDIDQIEISPHVRPEIVDSFKQMKDLWKQDRARMRTEVQRVTALEQQLREARANAWTPEAKADYEHAAGIRRRFDFASDPEFQAKYSQPIAQRYQNILVEAVEALPDRQAAEKWAEHMMQNFSPDQLNKNWWLNSVVNKIPDPLERQSLLSSVTELLRLQRDRDSELNQRTGDKSAFDQWITERTQTTAQRVQEEIMAEIGTQEQRIKDYLPRNIDEAKTKEEREALAAHNERFENLNTYFKNVMQDLSKNGPRAWVRASVEATRSLILEQEYKALFDELKTAKEERDKYKTELEKIHGARRRLATTPAAPATAPKKDGSLTIKDLDVRKSFESYDWGDR